MALVDEALQGFGNSWVSSILVGVGIVLIVPIVVPALAEGMRPLAKAVIKGSIMFYDKGAEMLAEVGEQLSDLVAEVRSELHETAAAANAGATAAPNSDPRGC